MRLGLVMRTCGVSLFVAGGCLLLPGCKPAAPAPQTDAAADATAQQAAAPEDGSKTRGLKVRPNVTAINGRWGLVLTQPLAEQNQQPAFRDVCPSIMEFEPPSTGKVIATMPQATAIVISDVQIDGPRIKFGVKLGEQAGDFEGELVDGVVRGSLQIPALGLIPAMLRPTDETTYEGWDPAPLTGGQSSFAEASKSKDQPAAILAVAREMRGSPLSLEAYEGILSSLGQFSHLDEAQVRQIYADALHAAAVWGPRLAEQVRFKAAMGVISARRFPDFAQEILAGMDQLSPDFKSQVQTMLEAAGDQVAVDLALRDLKSKSGEAQTAAFQQLQELLKKQRYNAEILGALGTYAAEHDQPDLATEYLADIVALPMLEAFLMNTRSGQPPGDAGPREQLLKLWEAKHGSVAGFDEFINATYERRLAELSQLAREQAPPPVDAAERKRTTFLEIFTGTGCPPCVAADLASATLLETYPTSDLVVLQYHQHIPAPDPLTNQDSEDRFAYYEGAGTPMAYIDGFMLPPQQTVGGFLQRVEPVYKELRVLVDARLKAESSGELALSADVKEGELSVSAKGTMFAEDLLPKLRLRLALVENHISFAAPNGIRQHHYVVREMLGGAKGSAARDGVLEYSLQMPLKEVEQHLQDYLQQFEAGRNVEFPIKPTTLGPLSLVGWVQNDSTREVLITKIIPVTGTEPAAPMPPAEKPVEGTPDAAKPDSPQPASEAAPSAPTPENSAAPAKEAEKPAEPAAPAEPKAEEPKLEVPQEAPQSDTPPKS